MIKTYIGQFTFPQKIPEMDVSVITNSMENTRVSKCFFVFPIKTKESFEAYSSDKLIKCLLQDSGSYVWTTPISK